MTSIPRRSGVSACRRHAPALAVVAALLLAAVMAGFGAHAGRAENSLPDPGWAITPVSTTSGLDDGQTVVVNLKANPDVKVFDLTIQECLAGQTYETASDVSPLTGKCPQQPLSSSADAIVHRSSSSGLIEASQSDQGATTAYRVGQGVAPLIGPSGGDITCDPTHDCTLVVKLILAGPQTVFWTTPLKFGSFDPIAGCGGAAAGIVATAGADHMQEAYSQWTLDQCKLPGASGASTRASFNGEGEAIKGFESGDVDLAYTSAGNNPDLDLAHTTPPGTRSAVATPIALNAAVIAVGGGSINSFGEKAPYADVRLKASDAAAMFTGGNSWVLRDDKPYKVSILATNPQLNGTMFASVPLTRPLAPAESESSTWFLTNYFAKLAPGDWIVPNDTTPRGATSAPALADPPFASGTIDLFSQRPALNKLISQNNASLTDGPIWVLTDLETARALHLTPVAIENADGAYVKPTAESMAAAVNGMKPAENGMLLPDPDATSATVASAPAGTKAQDVVEPYPLTFVEYAYAPAEQLVDPTTCTARTASQALLTAWLQYVTGPGQDTLPAGMVALPPTLKTVAESTIPTVGAAATTGPCAGRVTVPPPATGNAGSGATAFPVTGVNAPTGANVPNVNGGGANVPANAVAGGGDRKATAIAIPAFAGRKVIGTAGSILALLGIVLVTSLAAWITAGGDVTGVGASAATVPLTPKRIGSIALLWFAVGVAGIGLVVFQLGPLLAQREQRALLHDYRVQVNHAAAAKGTLHGLQTVSKAPEMGAPVGIIEIGALQVQDVVVEGVGPSQTSEAPGHVPGTAGLGQPGNSVVVARRNGYGATFKDLDQLRKGDRVVATTTQGQSVYSVRSVRTLSLSVDTGSDSSDSSSGSSAASGGTKTATFTSSTTKFDSVYGKSQDDRLTFVTSGSRMPWNSSDAVVVVAKLMGKPFPYTDQNGRSVHQTGMGGESGGWQGALLATLAFAAIVAGSVFLYRRLRFRTAYVLTIAPLVALTVIVGEAYSHLLPAWM